MLPTPMNASVFKQPVETNQHLRNAAIRNTYCYKTGGYSSAMTQRTFSNGCSSRLRRRRQCWWIRPLCCMNWFGALGISVLGIHQVSGRRFDSVLSRYAAVFDDDTNACSDRPVNIELEKNVTPKFLKCRPVPFAIRSKLNDALENLVKQGILKPVRYSKWASPIVPVLKRNGELRICGDYSSTVNLATKKDSYPLPTMTELLATLAGGVLFSKLDLSQAYQQFKVDKPTAGLLTLNTPKGLLQMTRPPFGIDVTPSIFQRFMDWMV
uniref:Reverse transcriptase domain-containing protein n=1 Tax=Trichuris muris TaxID=70415 RepID=A0A5S6QFP3_TRIMR